jgi:hypothetical protein
MAVTLAWSSFYKGYARGKEESTFTYLPSFFRVFNFLDAYS